MTDASEAIVRGCYICQPDDPNAPLEGCEACDQSAWDAQRVQWEAFVRAAHSEGRCEFSGMKSTECLRSVCDCFETPENAAAMQCGGCECKVCAAKPNLDESEPA